MTTGLQSDLFAPVRRLDVFHTWGWYAWRELAANGQALAWSGAQSLSSEAEALEHHRMVSARRW